MYRCRYLKSNHRSIRTQNWGNYFLDPRRGLGIRGTARVLEGLQAFNYSGRDSLL